MPKLKIGFVFDDSLDKPDGVQQYVLTLGTWLSQQGHEVHYLTGQTTRSDIPGVHSLSRNIGVRFNGNRMAIPLPVRRSGLRALLQKEQFDVLHVQAPFSPWLAARIMLAAPKRTVIVATFHILPQSAVVKLASRFLAIWTHRAWRRIDEVYSVSPAAADFCREVFGVESEVVPNVIVYDRFADAKPFERSGKRLELLYLGRLVPRKGCELLLRSIAQLDLARMPALRLTICGKGPLEASLKSYAEAQGLTDVVRFTGFVSETDKPRYYAGADIAVFPSSGGESFGIVLLEAMASGQAAVLAGNNPGYASVIDRSDLLFDATDTAALAQKLTDFITDPARRIEAAAWGKRQAARYDVGRVGKTIEQRYQHLCQQKNMR